MAAMINLPSSPKVSAQADTPQQAVNGGSEQNEGFSQALSQQMEKKQAAVEKSTIAQKARENVDNSSKNQPVKSVSPDTETIDKKVDAPVVQPEPAVSSPEELIEQASSTAVETTVMAFQQPSLQELIGLRLGTGNRESGKDLPLMAKLVESSNPDASIAQLIAARNARVTEASSNVPASVNTPSSTNVQAPVNVQASENSQTAVNAQTVVNVEMPVNTQPSAVTQSSVMDEQSLIVLQQRVQQQLALHPSEGSAESLKSVLHGVENALQSLSRAKGDHAELKGLEQVREQLLTRLQGLQGQNARSGGGNTNSGEQQANSSRLPFLQTMNTEEGGKLSELSKLTRVAFQEMLAQQQASSGQAQSSVVGTLPAGSSMSSLSAMLSPASTANPLLNYAPSSTTLNVPVNHPAWGQSVGERLQWMVKQDIQQAEIKLNPRSMGPIEIKIAMNQDQATVSFVANHAMTREALDAAVPRLREMFGESGLNLVDVNVSQNPDTSGQRASEKGEEAGNGHSTHSDADTVENDQTEDERYITSAGNEQWHSSNSVLDAYA